MSNNIAAIYVSVIKPTLEKQNSDNMNFSHSKKNKNENKDKKK